MNEINLFGKENYLQEIELLVNSVLKLLGIDNQVISISILSKREIRDMNFNYRKNDCATDVISFPFSDEFSDEGELGDLFIYEDVVRENAQKYGHSFNREYCFVIVHGILHLLGYDHQDKAQERIMFTLQESLIKELTEMELIE